MKFVHLHIQNTQNFHLLWSLILLLALSGCGLIFRDKTPQAEANLANLEKKYARSDFKAAVKQARALLQSDELKEEEKGRAFFILGSSLQKRGKELEGKYYFKRAIDQQYLFKDEEKEIARQALRESEILETAAGYYSDATSTLKTTNLDNAKPIYDKCDSVLQDLTTSYKMHDLELMEPYFLRGLVYFRLGNQAIAHDYFKRALKIDKDFQPVFRMDEQEKKEFDFFKENYLKEYHSFKGWTGRNWWKVVAVPVVGVLIYLIIHHPQSDLPAAPAFPSR